MLDVRNAVAAKGENRIFLISSAARGGCREESGEGGMICELISEMLNLWENLKRKLQ